MRHRALVLPLNAVVLLLNPALYAQAQTTPGVQQNSLDIVQPIETVADLQRELDQLETRSSRVDETHWRKTQEDDLSARYLHDTEQRG